MSGPKVDTAELRQQELERLENARDQRRMLAEKIRQSLLHVKSCLGEDFETMMQDETFVQKGQDMIKLQKEYEKKLERLLTRVKRGNELLDIEGIEKEHNALIREFNQKMRISPEKVSALLERKEGLKQLQKEGSRLSQIKRGEVHRISLEDIPEDAEVTSEQLNKQFEEILGDIKEFAGSYEMTGRHKNSVLLIGQDLNEVMESSLPNDTKSKRMRRILGEYGKMTALIHSEMEGVRAVYEEYRRECFDSDLPVSSITDFADKKELEFALANAKAAAAKRLSCEYIKRQIDDVMAKHGYDVVRSDMLEETNAAGQILYGVNDDTAINVFVSDENQVTMRVVGIGFDAEVSEAEDERLFQEQCAFCSMHPQIVAELEMRGVLLKTKKHAPPDRRFNKKIKIREKTDAQSKSRLRKELKRQELKTMHRK